jgi:hypothetical protein
VSVLACQPLRRWRTAVIPSPRGVVAAMRR